MIFMGEEWGGTRPFLFFCDFDGDLAEAVRKGRREEFARFPEFSDPERVAKIPDPLAEATFLASKIDWERFDSDAVARLSGDARGAPRASLPLLPRDRGAAGRPKCWAKGPCGSPGAPGARALVLDANSRRSPVAFPPAAGRVFWTLRRRGRNFGPWSVRWSVEPP